MNYAKKGRNLVDFNKSKTKNGVFSAIDKIDLKYRAAASNAGAALNEVQSKFFTKNLDRPEAENIVILITDAKNSDQSENMVKEADELRKSGFKIITVGIRGADANELKGVASQSSMSFYSPSFERALTGGFTESVWDVLNPAASVPATSPTRVPAATSPSRVVTTKVTQESVSEVVADTGSEADIVFAVHFNPRGSNTEFLQLIDYLKSLVLTSDVNNQKVRFGLYFDKNNFFFQLKDYTNTSAIIDALGTASKSLTTTDQFDLVSVLRDVRTRMFTPANGDRANVQNILIVFTDTVTSGAALLLQRERNLLNNNKIIVYSAGIGLNDKAALETISDETNLVTFSDYSELKSYGEQLLQLIPAMNTIPAPTTTARPKDTVPPTRPGSGKQTDLEETEENEIDTHSTLDETIENNINIFTITPATAGKFIGCAGAKLDLVFVLDASTSVTEPNFELMKDFVKDFLLDADIDGGNVRVGVVIYSDADYVQFQLNTYAKKADVYNAIDDIPYRYGSTNTADALKTMRSVMFTAGNGDRSDVNNVAVVVTDGVSNINSRRTVPEAEQARAEGIHIYAIGIGLTDTKELDGIASKPVDENRFAVQDFTELRDLRHKVFSALCKCFVIDYFSSLICYAR
uniref:VWFA domain-containing protein n=1 Tax=Biomphalaria glabrata TaxID=6526 RepID=A0A2C9JVB5_BIOGL